MNTAIHRNITNEPSEIYGQTVLGTDTVIPVAISETEIINGERVANFVFSRYAENNTPQNFYDQIYWKPDDDTLEAFLTDTFGETFLPLVQIISQGESLTATRKAISDWWSPSLPNNRGQLP